MTVEKAAGSTVLQPVVESSDSIRRPSLEERLQLRKRKLTEELADVTRALEMLQQNPQAAEMLNLLARLGAVY